MISVRRWKPCGLTLASGTAACLVPLGRVSLWKGLKSSLKAQLGVTSKFAWSPLFKCPRLLSGQFLASQISKSPLLLMLIWKLSVELAGQLDTDEYRKDFCLLKPHESQQLISVRAERKLKWVGRVYIWGLPCLCLKTVPSQNQSALLSSLTISSLGTQTVISSPSVLWKYWASEVLGKRHCLSLGQGSSVELHILRGC